MKWRKNVSLSVCLIFMVICALQIGAKEEKVKPDPWKLLKNKNGVKVFARHVPGSKYRELLAKGVVSVPFEVGLELVKDCDSYHEWYGMCKQLYVIRKISEKEYFMYFVLDMPLLTDRDVVVRVTADWDMEKKNGWVKLVSINSKYKMDSGLVRMPGLSGGFTFREVAEGKFEVTYKVHADLGGSLPAWMVNIAAKKHPYQTAVGARRHVKSEKYFKRAENLYGKKFMKN